MDYEDLTKLYKKVDVLYVGVFYSNLFLCKSITFEKCKSGVFHSIRATLKYFCSLVRWQYKSQQINVIYKINFYVVSEMQILLIFNIYASYTYIFQLIFEY